MKAGELHECGLLNCYSPSVLRLNSRRLLHRILSVTPVDFLLLLHPAFRRVLQQTAHWALTPLCVREARGLTVVQRFKKS